MAVVINKIAEGTGLSHTGSQPARYAEQTTEAKTLLWRRRGGKTYAPHIAALTSVLIAHPAFADERSLDAFSAHCFSPLMTAERAAERFDGLRYDFYDLDPFSAANAPSAPVGRAVTAGTDRRCEIAFDGAAVDAGKAAVLEALEREGITAPADVPADFPRAAGAEVVAARFLNPRRIAVVQIGTRPGPNGIETFLNVERLEPLP